MLLGEFLKRYRLKYNLTQQQMAEKLETSQSYYSQVEGGTLKPGFQMVRRIAKCLDVEESFIRSLL